MENQAHHGVAHPHPNLEHLIFSIEGKQYSTTQQYYTGIELKQLAGIPEDVSLYLQIQQPYQHELIENSNRVNIARPDIEHFFVQKEDKLEFFINSQPFTSYKQYITGAELRQLGSIPSNEALYLDLQGKWQDDFITNDEIVDLARDGVEKFISKVVSFTLIVNAEEKTWNSPLITFEEIVRLAYDNFNPNPVVAYTVTYTNGVAPHSSGNMAKGSSVSVKDKMKFNVDSTSQS